MEEEQKEKGNLHAHARTHLLTCTLFLFSSCCGLSSLLLQAFALLALDSSSTFSNGLREELS